MTCNMFGGTLNLTQSVTQSNPSFWSSTETRSSLAHGLSARPVRLPWTLPASLSLGCFRKHFKTFLFSV